MDVYRGDANDLVAGIDPVDLVYLDPPYNQHPYGSNSFMLNFLVDYREPEAMSRASGIPNDWVRSDYNRPHKAFDAFSRLVHSVNTKFLLISFNSEGFIAKDQMLSLLSSVGNVDIDGNEVQYLQGQPQPWKP